MKGVTAGLVLGDQGGASQLGHQGKRYVEVRAEDLAANWPEQRRALFELLGVGDFATRSTFQSHSLEKRNDQFDPGIREFIERTLDGVIPAMGYA
jgi:hypothetical protein